MTDDFIKWIEERLAAHEGGAGNISIGWDDATFEYIISQRTLHTQSYEILGCSRFLSRAITLAMNGEKYD